MSLSLMFVCCEHMEQTDELQISLAESKYSGKYATRMRSGVKTERPQAKAAAWAAGRKWVVTHSEFFFKFWEVKISGAWALKKVALKNILGIEKTSRGEGLEIWGQPPPKKDPLTDNRQAACVGVKVEQYFQSVRSY